MWVPEWHPSGHGLHVHFGVGRYVPRGLIERAWGRGYVHIKLLGNLPMRATTREQSRRVAFYLSKYVSKTFDTGAQGRHRYEVAQGFQPAIRRLTGRSVHDVLAQACEVMGGEPEERWSSAEAADWQAPQAVWFAWA